jgi:hypothetical protein
MNLQEIGLGVDQIALAHDTDKQRAHVNTVTTLWVA